MSALRIARPGSPARLIPDTAVPDTVLTSYQRRVLDLLRAHNGNRSRAARELGTTTQSVQSTVRVIVRAGIRVPAAVTGRAGRPDLGPRQRPDPDPSCPHCGTLPPAYLMYPDGRPPIRYSCACRA